MARGKKLNPADFNMFPKSKPFGYYPVAVEEEIHKYESALDQSLNKIRELEKENSRILSNSKHLESELQRLHLEMSSLELPSIDEAVAGFVLEEFKTHNRPQSEVDKEWKSIRPTKVKPEGKTTTIDISGGDDDDDVNKGGGDSFIIAQ